ncbi:MAG: hypothetical protein AAFY11_05775 [Cyanobacteria bacterium J06641_5]
MFAAIFIFFFVSEDYAGCEDCWSSWWLAARIRDRGHSEPIGVGYLLTKGFIALIGSCMAGHLACNL